jgi:hypothetical protein
MAQVSTGRVTLMSQQTEITTRVVKGKRGSQPRSPVGPVIVESRSAYRRRTLSAVFFWIKRPIRKYSCSLSEQTTVMTHSRGGRLAIYVDCGQYRAVESIKIMLTPPVSPYSWFGFTNVRNFRPQLESHGIEVCIEPFFLGGARDGVGNPYTPPPQAKAAFAQQDLDLTSKLLGLEVVRPKVFPISSLFVSTFA